MASDKYVAVINGRLSEREATASSSGSGNAGDVVALDDSGRISNTMMPTGVGAATKQVIAAGALNAGDFVNVYDDAGVVSARRADATTQGKEAVGYVLASVASGESVEVYLGGVNTSMSSLTAGTRYYLSTTAGGVVAIAPSGSGNVVPPLGRALSDSELLFNPETSVIRA